MIHIDDIEEDLAGGNISGLEGAFRALVDFPRDDEIEGAAGVDTLMDVFGRVCEALVTNDGQLPRGTVQLLVAEKTADYDALLSTYAAGARFVLRNIERWRSRFDGNLAKVGRASPAPS